MKSCHSYEVKHHALAGCLIGGAVGDAIGLPAEGLSSARQVRLFGTIAGYRFLFGRGMVSDDTEHAYLTLQALIGAGGDADRFETLLAQGLRRWIVTLPAGVGLATLKACLRLWVGVPPSRSGVRSAGNGPLMRAAIIGVVYGSDLPRLRALIQRSTRITHTDPLAERAALLVAVAAHLSRLGQLSPAHLRQAWHPLLESSDNTLHWEEACESAENGETSAAFARRLGLSHGVSGYVAHTLPVVLHAALLHPSNLLDAVLTVVACGGDTDTTAAIVGSIVGANVRVKGIPPAWCSGLAEPFLNASHLTQEAERFGNVLRMETAARPRWIPYPLALVRNLGFLGVVLYHGLRRLLPPY